MEKISMAGRTLDQWEDQDDETSETRMIGKQIIVLDGSCWMGVNWMLLATISTVDGNPNGVLLQKILTNTEHGSKDITIGNEALQRLIAALGYQHMDAVMAEAVKVSTENEELRATIATLQAHENTYSNELLEEIRQLTTQNNQLIDDAERRRYLQENNTELRAQLAQMQSQESFRVALLESVVSAARKYMNAERGQDNWEVLGQTLTALDHWQPEAPPAAPAGNDGYCPKCGNIVVLKNGHCHLCGGPTWESLDEYEATRADYLSTHAAPAEDVPNPDEDLEQYERDKAEVQA